MSDNYVYLTIFFIVRVSYCISVIWESKCERVDDTIYVLVDGRCSEQQPLATHKEEMEKEGGRDVWFDISLLERKAFLNNRRFPRLVRCFWNGFVLGFGNRVFVVGTNHGTNVFVGGCLGPSQFPCHDAVQSQNGSFQNAIIQWDTQGFGQLGTRKGRNGNGSRNTSILITAFHRDRPRRIVEI